MKKSFIFAILSLTGIIQSSTTSITDLRQVENDAIRKFYEACRLGNFAEVQLFVESNQFDLNRECEQGLTGICRAGIFKKKEVYDYLLSKGAIAKEEYKDKNDETFEL